MRNVSVGLAALALAVVGTQPLAAQGPTRDERPIRPWAVEMRDKAEHSLYQKRDCRQALQQANAAYYHTVRDPRQMDPRIVLVKARAHDCLGQLPAAIASYGLHDELTGVDPRQDLAIGGACQALSAPMILPPDSAERADLRDSLAATAHAARQVLLRAERERGRSDFGDQYYSVSHRTNGMEAPDGTIHTEGQIAGLWPRYVQSWSSVRAYNAQGFRTTNATRYAHASGEVVAYLADAEARLICLELAY